VLGQGVGRDSVSFLSRYVAFSLTAAMALAILPSLRTPSVEGFA
jgi:hypothetical protein